MQDFAEGNGFCNCPPMQDGSPCNAIRDKHRPNAGEGKFWHEISTEMIDNALIIRVEKDKNRVRRMRGNWDPPCDCEMVEIRRPKTGEEKAKIVNGGDNNQVLFKVFSKGRLTKDENAKPQTIAYKVGSCRGGAQSNDQCRTITVHPQMGGPGSQQVYSDHLTDGNHDVFLLRIKKKGDSFDPKNRNIELELRTPKPPTPLPPPKIPPPSPPAKLQENMEAASKPEKSKKTGKAKGKGKANGKGKK